jgi:hypothetical protein
MMGVVVVVVVVIIYVYDSHLQRELICGGGEG